MKKVFLSFGFALLATTGVMAQSAEGSHAGHNHGTAAPTISASSPLSPVAAAAPTTSLKPENVSFKNEIHDFGNVQEGPSADYEFTFKNTGKEPIILTNVQASCGCTTPSWSKDPVLPGKTGTVKASYNTVGRPGPFTKSITVTSNAGVRILTIKGNVEKAPTSSVPENNSLLRTN